MGRRHRYDTQVRFLPFHVQYLTIPFYDIYFYLQLCSGSEFFRSRYLGPPSHVVSEIRPLFTLSNNARMATPAALLSYVL
jgi:hypothetical protein